MSDKPRINPGTACTAQQIRKAAGPATVLEQPYAIRYMIRIPHSIAHCCIPTIRPRMLAGASSARYTQTCEDVTPTDLLVLLVCYEEMRTYQPIR